MANITYPPPAGWQQPEDQPGGSILTQGGTDPTKGPCNAVSLIACLDRFGCCYSIEQLQAIIVYLLATIISTDPTTIQDLAAEGAADAVFRDERQTWAALACLIARIAGNTDNAATLWSNAQTALVNFNTLRPERKWLIVIVGLCQYLEIVGQA